MLDCGQISKKLQFGGPVLIRRRHLLWREWQKYNAYYRGALVWGPPVVRVNTVCRLNFMCFDDKQLRTYRTLHGQVFFGKSSVSTRTTGREILLWVVLYAVRNRCITQESQIWYDSGGGIKDYTLKIKTYDFQQIHRLHCYSFEKQFSLVNMVF